MFLTFLADLLKKLPMLCWAVIALCALMYTSTVCYVMLRSSAVSVTIDGMTMEMTRAAATTNSAAGDLEAAAQTIEQLKAELAAARPERPSDEIPRAPVMTAAAPAQESVEDGLKGKAAKMRQQSQQILQQAQQQQQQQQQRQPR